MRIDEMPAGREMDKAIGQYIFKYWVDHYDKDCAENCYYCLIDGSGDAVIPGLHEGERRTEEEAWADCPEFSTDIAAAWQVVEQVTKTQCDDTGSFYVFKIVKKHHKWCTYIKHPLWSGIHSELGKNYEMYQAYADTAPLAICRCALKVEGVEI